MFIGQITLNLTRFLSFNIPFLLILHSLHSLTNFTLTNFYTHFRAESEVVTVSQLKLTSLPNIRTFILLLLIFKRILGLFVRKLRKYSNAKIAINLSSHYERTAAMVTNESNYTILDKKAASAYKMLVAAVSE